MIAVALALLAANQPAEACNSRPTPAERLDCAKKTDPVLRKPISPPPQKGPQPVVPAMEPQIEQPTGGLPGTRKPQ